MSYIRQANLRPTPLYDGCGFLVGMAAQRIQKASTMTAPADSGDTQGPYRALFAIVSQLRRIADTLDRTPAEAAPTPEEAPALAPNDEALFQELRKWRADEARKLGMPPYIVATDKVLRVVAQTRPATVEDLRKVPGFGPSKTEKYGPGLVEVVSAV